MAGDANLLPLEMEATEPTTPAGSGPARKARDDLDRFTSRLQDAGFSMKKYPDPLASRQGVDPRLFPDGVTLAMEKRWLDKISDVNQGF